MFQLLLHRYELYPDKIGGNVWVSVFPVIPFVIEITIPINRLDRRTLRSNRPVAVVADYVNEHDISIKISFPFNVDHFDDSTNAWR